MKQIIVIGDNSSTNLGDPILTRSAYYIIKKVVAENDYEISIFDIAGRIASSRIVSISDESHDLGNFFKKPKMFLKQSRL